MAWESAVWDERIDSQFLSVVDPVEEDGDLRDKAECEMTKRPFLIYCCVCSRLNGPPRTSASSSSQSGRISLTPAHRCNPTSLWLSLWTAFNSKSKEIRHFVPILITSSSFEQHVSALIQKESIFSRHSASFMKRRWRRCRSIFQTKPYFLVFCGGATNYTQNVTAH